MNPLQVLLIIGAIAYVMVRRFAGQPLTARSITIPLALTVFGGYQLIHHRLSAIDVAVVAVEAAVGLAVGAVRGTTIRIYRRDGYLWQRYSLLTLAVWAVAIVLRAGLALGGHLVGADLATGATVALLLGASLLAESGVVAVRAARTGVPCAPARRRPRAGASVHGYR